MAVSFTFKVMDGSICVCVYIYTYIFLYNSMVLAFFLLLCVCSMHHSIEDNQENIYFFFKT